MQKRIPCIIVHFVRNTGITIEIAMVDMLITLAMVCILQLNNKSSDVFDEINFSVIQ